MHEQRSADEQAHYRQRYPYSPGAPKCGAKEAEINQPSWCVPWGALFWKRKVVAPQILGQDVSGFPG